MEALADELASGRRALERARWTAARHSFGAVLAGGESAEAHEGLGLALWFAGEVSQGIESRARAFELHRRAGSCSDAARTAVWVSHQHFVAGRLSAARGWLARAERVLEDVEECEGHGWVAVERARHATDLETRTVHADEAMAIAHRCRAGDLETFALSVAGRARVEAGHVEDGLRLLEEAMAGATGGHVGDIHTLAEAYCNLILACTSAGDWSRATEWCRYVEAFARAHEAAPLFGSCRGVHADVLMATGHWAEAEEALETSVATHARFVPQMADPSVAALAELRVHQDRLPEAASLLAGREQSPPALHALALLRLAEGHAEAAATLLERGLQHGAGSVVSTSRILAALVDARITLGDVPGARGACSDLVELGTATGIHLVTARAALAEARVARSAGQAEDAATAARLALAAFLGLGMPLDAAEARLELARALVVGLAVATSEVARDEARSALTVFLGLGAARECGAARALLHQMAGAAAGHDRSPGPLTPREQQVLELVARGFSNAAIATTLVISEKTAGHHVSHILAKLGVRNRTEAAAHVGDQPRGA